MSQGSTPLLDTEVSAMKLANLDLNLLVALHALLDERSVTRAADRLGLTQPTLSASLARLRRHFDDELLYRSGNSYHLTPLAVNLANRTSSALDEVERIFASQNAAEPAQSTREFVIVCSDYTAAVVGGPVSAAINALAPGVRMQFRQNITAAYASEEGRLRSVDAAIMPHGFLHDMPHMDLYEDSWVCLVSEDNDSVGEELTMDDLSRLPWVVTSRESTYTTTGVRHLAQMGAQINVQIAVDTFLAVPFLIAGTNRIALVQQRTLTLLGELPGVRILPCPYDPGPLVIALWWHQDFDRDPEHLWLRRQVAGLIGQLFGSAAPASA